MHRCERELVNMCPACLQRYVSRDTFVELLTKVARAAWRRVFLAKVYSAHWLYQAEQIERKLCAMLPPGAALPPEVAEQKRKATVKMLQRKLADTT